MPHSQTIFVFETILKAVAFETTVLLAQCLLLVDTRQQILDAILCSLKT